MRWRQVTAGAVVRHPLTWILLAGAVIRLALWLYWAELPLRISDEQSYDQLARGIVEVGAYVDERGTPTSLRPPLYPAALAAVYYVFGVGNLAAVRAIQAALSLLTVAITYRLGVIAFSRRLGTWAAACVCFYPSLLAYNNLLLSEVLFTLLLCGATLAVVEAMQRESYRWLLATGVFMALAALTRSIVMLFVPVLGLILVCGWQGSVGRRLMAATLPAMALMVVVAPWSYRNSALQRTFVAIDVMGGRNLMMGNYEYTPLERSWATISTQTGEREWYRVLAKEPAESGPTTQGQLDKRALRHAVRFMLDHPWLTLKRDVVKFFNFWQLEREVIAGANQGIFGGWPGPTLLVATVLVCGCYAVAILAGIFGMTLGGPTERRIHWLLMATILFPCAIHTLIFAHSRYHLPIMPFVLIYAVSAGTCWREIWARRRHPAFWGAAALCMLLILGWLRELVFVDLAHVREILG